MDQQKDGGQSGRIHVQYHGNHPQDNEFFDWDDELSAGLGTGSGSITATAIAENSASIKNVLEDFEEFNLDDCEELTEEEKELLLLYIQNNHGSVVFTDVNDDDMQQSEPPPDYGDYYSGRYLETIYEEDSDDLRSWDSDEVDEILRLSPSSDEPLAVSPVARKKGKEPDKDSSYDSDFSMVNSTECLDIEHQLDKDDHKSQRTSDVGLSSDDEINPATLYHEEDIDDVLSQVVSPSFNCQHAPEVLQITSFQTGSDASLQDDNTCYKSKNEFYSNSDNCSKFAENSENFVFYENDEASTLQSSCEAVQPSVRIVKVTSSSDVITQVSDGEVAPSITRNAKLDTNLAEKINSDYEVVKKTDKEECQHESNDKSNLMKMSNDWQQNYDYFHGQNERCDVVSRTPTMQVPINDDYACKVNSFSHGNYTQKSLSSADDNSVFSHSASEELYNMLPKVDELPEIKEICYSWFEKSPAGKIEETDEFQEEEEEEEETSVYNSGGDKGKMCQSDENGDWEQWLARSLDERSGRHVTSGAAYLNNHDQQLNLPTCNNDEGARHDKVFSGDDVLISNHCVESELTRTVFDRKRGRSLPRNYQPWTDVDDSKDDTSTKRGHDQLVVKCTRGNSLTDIPLQSVGGSRDSPSSLIYRGTCRSLIERSKSTPDLSTKGGKREETLVKRIEHTSQVKLEVCELSPGLQYKKHCVIVNESVSAKTAKFEALVNDNKNRNSTPEVCDARAIHHSSSSSNSESAQRRLSFGSSDESFAAADEEDVNTMIGGAQLSYHAGTTRRRHSPADCASPSNGMWIANAATTSGGDRTIKNACDAEPSSQLRPPKTDVSKLVAMFENEIKKSEPRQSSAALVIRGGDRISNRNATSSSAANIIDVSPEHFNKITGLQSGIRATALKPPLPPQLQESFQQSPSRPLLESTPRTWRYVSARKHFLNSQVKNEAREEEGDDSLADGEERKLVRLTSDRLSKFQRSTQEQRARLAKSVPDLASTADKLYSEVRLASSRVDQPSPSTKVPKSNIDKKIASKRRQELSKSRNEDEWDKLLTAAAAHYGRRYENAKNSEILGKNNCDKLSKSHGYLETDLDTLECREVDQTNLDDVFCDAAKTSSSTTAGRSRAKSLISLGLKNEISTASSDGGSVDGSRAKSMEFLLDDDNKAATVAPENQLMRDGKVPSEHELRFQKSLKNLTLPSWYRDPVGKSNIDNEQDPATVTPRWQGLGSRSSSASSLSGSKPVSSNSKPVIVPKRVTADWRFVKYGINSSKESLTTPRSPSTAPDSPTEESSFSYHPSLSRWNTARSSTSSFGGSSIYRSFRQPYLGWRSSAERLCANSGHPSNSSSQCPSPSSSAISAASSSFAFRPDRMNFGAGLSKWGNLGTMNLMYNTDTESELDFNSRPSSALAEGANHFQGFKSSWRPSTVEDQQVEPQVKSENVKTEPRFNGHSECQQTIPSPSKHVWIESSFVGHKQNLTSGSPVPSPNNCATTNNYKSAMIAPDAAAVTVQPSERHQESNRKSTATLEEVLDSLLGLKGPSIGRSRRRRYSGLTRVSKSSSNLENYYITESSISEVEKSAPKVEAHQEALEESNKRLDETAMEFRRVAQELSERIQLLKCEPDEPKNETEKPNTNGLDVADSDILQQYACDYSCLNLNVSSENNFGDHGLMNTESFPFYDDEDIDEPRNSLASPEVEVVKSEQPKASARSSPPPTQDAESDPSDLAGTIVNCHHPKCREQSSYREAQRNYKSCHYCYTVYCSRQCRRNHWEKHRKECMFARVSKMCDNTVQKIKSDSKSRVELSKFARTGYLTRGRGVLKLVFSCPELAWHFIDRGWSAIMEEPIYVAWRDVLPQEMGADAYLEIRNMCQRYDPEVKFVLIVAIYVTTQIKGTALKRTPAAGYEREVLMKCTKMRLSPTTTMWQPNHCNLNNKPITASPFDAKDLIKGTP